MTLTHLRTVPILRSYDEAKAREFYVDWLGFSVDWEHRFEPNAPLYMQVSRDGIAFHISEHHGDGSPGSHVRVEIRGVREFYAELIARKYPPKQEVDFEALADMAGSQVEGGLVLNRLLRDQTILPLRSTQNRPTEPK